jgi:hypothetical protein
MVLDLAYNIGNTINVCGFFFFPIFLEEQTIHGNARKKSDDSNHKRKDIPFLQWEILLACTSNWHAPCIPRVQIQELFRNPRR